MCLVCTGNHAQALAHASTQFNIPAYIVMPSTSAPSKIAATQALTPHVIFSGPSSEEREEKVEEIIRERQRILRKEDGEGRGEGEGEEKDYGPILVPPYDHGDIILGQGTVGLEIEEQFADRRVGQVCTVYGSVNGKLEMDRNGDSKRRTDGGQECEGGSTGRIQRPKKQLDAVIAPCGGGGLLSGIATYFSDLYDEDDNDNDNDKDEDKDTKEHATTPPPPLPFCSIESPNNQNKTNTEKVKNNAKVQRTPYIIGAEPHHQNANTASRSLAQGSRIPSKHSTTIADGLRTPLGVLNWGVISRGREMSSISNGTTQRETENGKEEMKEGKREERKMVEGVYTVSEEEIKHAMKLLLERAKWMVEPSAAVGLAVVLFNEELRRWVAGEQEMEMEMEAKAELERGREKNSEGQDTLKDGKQRRDEESGRNEQGEVRPWHVAIVLSGGNTTVEAIAQLFAPTAPASERQS